MIIWQDAAVSIASAVFAVNLIPTIRDIWKAKQSTINFWTSSTTAVFMVVIAIAMFTLGLWVTVVVDVAVATCWFIIMFQTIWYRRLKHETIESENTDS